MAKMNSLDTVKVTKLIDELKGTKLREVDKAVLVSSWIFENFGKTRRTFRYSDEVEAVDPACKSDFARTFSHRDWVDGESVVQAEQTIAEDGFNHRFHQIEDDLDGLHTDLEMAFKCLAELRSGIADALDEIKTELNRINTDLHECCSESSPGRVLRPSGAVFGNLINTGRMIGSAKFGEQDVNVWETPQGMIMLPRTTVAGISAASDVRIKSAAELAKVIEDSQDIKTFFRNRVVTKRHMVRKFGNVRADDGRTIEDLVTVLPDNTQRADLEKFVEALGDAEARVLASTPGTSEAVAASLGVDRDDAKVADASIAQLDDIPSNVVAGMSARGIKTIGDLAGKTTAQIKTALAAANVRATAGEIASWHATAATLKGLSS